MNKHATVSLPSTELSSARHGYASSANPRSKPLLICFSHLRWDFVWQRPQHLLTRAAHEFEVVFFEEPIFAGNDSPRLSVSRREQGFIVAVPHLSDRLDPAARVVAQRDLLEFYLDGRPERPRLFWYYTPMAIDFSRHLDRDLTVYDNMDELSAFKGASPALLDREDALLQQADVVFTGGLSLYEAKRGRHVNLHAFPSSVDVDHFSQARRRRAARRREPHGSSQPRLGFFGVIDERLDLDLVDRIAAMKPDWLFDFVGPVVKIDPATLPRRANLAWTGACPYADLPRRLSEWDLGIMPFALNEATRFISPTKTPEFLAAGLPVVSTPIVDVVRCYGERGLVSIAATPDAFVGSAEALLTRQSVAWLAAVDRELATSSWDTTWAAMHAEMVRAMRPVKARGTEPKAFPGATANVGSHQGYGKLA